MNRSHILAVGFGVAALVLTTLLRSEGDGHPALAPPSPHSTPVPTGTSESSQVQQLETEERASGDMVRIEVSGDDISEPAEGSRVWGHVYDALDRPVSGVGIGVRPWHDPGRRVIRTAQEDEALSRFTTTDAAGLYELTNVVPGRYTVYDAGWVERLQGHTASITVDDDLEYDVRLYGFVDPCGQVVRLYAGPVQLQLFRGKPPKWAAFDRTWPQKIATCRLPPPRDPLTLKP